MAPSGKPETRNCCQLFIISDNCGIIAHCPILPDYLCPLQLSANYQQLSSSMDNWYRIIVQFSGVFSVVYTQFAGTLGRLIRLYSKCLGTASTTLQLSYSNNLSIVAQKLTERQELSARKDEKHNKDIHTQ